jgi:hypothetical protein
MTSKSQLSFIDKLKIKDGNNATGTNISKLLQSFLLSKWKEIETKKQMLNYEEEGNCGLISLHLKYLILFI